MVFSLARRQLADIGSASCVHTDMAWDSGVSTSDVGKKGIVLYSIDKTRSLLTLQACIFTGKVLFIMMNVVL